MDGLLGDGSRITAQADGRVWLVCLAFFAHWTCKEAYLKARGDGLFVRLDSFSVVPALDRAPVELQIADADDRECWSVRRLKLAGPLAAAIAIEGSGQGQCSSGWPL